MSDESDDEPLKVVRIADGHFRGMKEILSSMEPDTDLNTVTELKERTHLLCARFLGGAWKNVPLDDLRISRIKGGMSNMLFLCRLSERHRPIRGEPDKNVIWAQNCTEFSQEVDWKSTFREIALPTMSAKIAKRVAKVHQLEVPIWKEPDYICDALDRWLVQLMQTPSGESTFNISDDYSEFIPEPITCQTIARELEYLRSMISKSCSVVAFTHNDLQEGNILLPKGSSGNIRLPSLSDEFDKAFNPFDPRLVLIDFEYASYNYRGFDFANHFVEWTIDYDCDEAPYYTVKTQFSYLREYGNTPEKEITKKSAAMVEETLPFVPVSHFFWGVWALLQFEVSPVGFGFADYARDRIGLYFKHKSLLDGFNQT